MMMMEAGSKAPGGCWAPHPGLEGSGLSKSSSNRGIERIMRRVVLGAVLVAAVSTAAPAADVENGKTIWNKCRACHQVGENAKNLVGPILNGLIGRKAGSIEGYKYSEANKNSGIVWDDATFREYIKNPKGKIPNTKMVFAGLTDEQDIDDLLAYLKQFGPDGKIAQ
jgi:cytochrome c